MILLWSTYNVQYVILVLLQKMSVTHIYMNIGDADATVEQMICNMQSLVEHVVPVVIHRMILTHTIGITLCHMSVPVQVLVLCRMQASLVLVHYCMYAYGKCRLVRDPHQPPHKFITTHFSHFPFNILRIPHTAQRMAHGAWSIRYHAYGI